MRYPDEAVLTAVAEEYLRAYCGPEMGLNELAEQIGDRPLAADIIPIAVAGDEHDWPYNLARLYNNRWSRQKGTFSVILGLNGNDHTPIAPETVAATERAKQDFPGLDLRVINLGILSTRGPDGAEKRSILSPLRKRIVGASLAALLRQNRVSKDVLFHLHDADLINASDDYLPIVRKSNKANPGAPLVANAQFETYPDKPGLSALIRLSSMDDIFYPWDGPPIFEAAVSMSLPTYLRANGYAGEYYGLGATIRLVHSTGKQPVAIPNTLLVYSSRRQAEVFLNLPGSGVIWERGGNFDEGLAYRTSDPQADIDLERLESIRVGTILSDYTTYRSDILTYTERGLGFDPPLEFEEGRERLWSWLRQRLAAAQPRIEEYRHFLTEAKNVPYLPPAQKDLSMLESWAHQCGLQALMKVYGVTNLERLVQGGIPNMHETFLKLAQVTGRRWSIIDEVYAEQTGAS